MSSPTIVFDRFMSAKYLHENKDIQWNCEHELQDDTHVHILKDRVDRERIFRIPLGSKVSGKTIEDIEFSLEIGLETTGATTSTLKDPLSLMLASNEHAIGIRLRNTKEYTTVGPYTGVEGMPGRVLDHIGAEGLNEEKAKTARWPRVFNITIKPLEKLAYCYTGIDGGHLFTVEYDKYNPTINLRDSDLFFDIYRFDDQETYVINYVKITLKMITK